MALATVSEAKIANFTYSGVITKKGGLKCTGRIGVSSLKVTDQKSGWHENRMLRKPLLMVQIS